MGIVIDPNKWREDSLKGLKCARTFSTNKPTSQCSICSIWYCYEHVQSHYHIETPQDRDKRREDTEKLR
ncbi:MAG TPA: hypothetical protein VEW92_04985 [Nitrososphaeraceae archaeon]|nr:hypothetical protein [Nitrososphaeraceae archaeon]